VRPAWVPYLIALCLGLSAGIGRAETDHAVILVYHHVSDDTPASTSVTPAQFERHLEFLEAEGFEVWSLPRLLAAVFDHAEPLPPDTVAITFDDAYESVFSVARPRLDARGWPFSVFVNTDAIDAGHSPYMDWNDLRALAEEGATLGNHSAAHGHMARSKPGESHSAWQARVSADIDRAHHRLTVETGREPELFAYPYGEDSLALAELVESRYRWALAQRSGPVGSLTDPLSIPRFPLATGFASLDRLELAVRSRPLSVRRIETGAVGERGDIDSIQFSLDAEGFRAEELGCFSGTGDPLSFESTNERGDSLLLRIDVVGIGRPGRNKVNCTAPASDDSGDFYWHSFQWRIEP